MIKLIGIGTGGIDVVGRLAGDLPAGVEGWAVSPDATDFARARGLQAVEIGRQLTRGLGAGGNTDVGTRAAEESRLELAAAVGGADHVVLVAPLGGGTGTGAGPVVARLAAEGGARVIAVVTRPVTFEGRRRGLQADAGIAALRLATDLLVVVPNDCLRDLMGSRLSLQAAFGLVDSLVAHLLGPLGAQSGLQDPEQLALAALDAAGLPGCEVVVSPGCHVRWHGANAPSGLEPVVAKADAPTGLEPSL